MNDGVLFAILIGCGVILLFSFHFYSIVKHTGIFQFRLIGRLVFVVAYIVSGLSHLIYQDNYYRGFFDVGGAGYSNIYFMTILAIGYLVFCYSQDYFYKSRNDYDGFVFGVYCVHKNRDQFILLFGVALVVLGLWANINLGSLVELDAISRNREMPPGSAKYVFLSVWFGWGVSFIFIYMIDRFRPSPYIASLLIIASIFLIVFNVIWMGGRSMAVLLVLPVWIVYQRNYSRGARMLAPVLGVLFIFYVILITQLRKFGYSVEETSLSQILDWEFGRYSMIGYAVDYVDRLGYLWGVGYYDALIRIVLSPFYFMGLGFDFVGSMNGTTVGIIGDDLFGGDVSYVVPGAIPEAYMNFGFLGVVALCAISGSAFGYVDKKLSGQKINSGMVLIYAYFGSVLAFNFINSTFLAFLNYIFFMGLPVVVLMLRNLIYGRRYLSKLKAEK